MGSTAGRGAGGWAELQKAMKKLLGVHVHSLSCLRWLVSPVYTHVSGRFRERTFMLLHWGLSKQRNLKLWLKNKFWKLEVIEKPRDLKRDGQCIYLLKVIKISIVNWEPALFPHYGQLCTLQRSALKGPFSSPNEFAYTTVTEFLSLSDGKHPAS